MKTSEKVVLFGIAGILLYLYKDKIFPAIGSAVTNATQAAGGAVSDTISDLTGRTACENALIDGTDSDIVSACANIPEAQMAYQAAYARLHPGSTNPPIDVTGWNGGIGPYISVGA